VASIVQDLAMRGEPWIDVLRDAPISRIDHNV
jgi:hypothetical protein